MGNEQHAEGVSILFLKENKEAQVSKEGTGCSSTAYVNSVLAV